MSASETDSGSLLKPTSVVKKKAPPKQKTATEPKSQDLKLTTKPKTSEMVNQALNELANRKGCSLQAIKKYIALKYSVDIEKTTFFIKKYLKKSVEDGSIIQLKGKGASGSFKVKPVQKRPAASKPPKKIPEKESKNMKEKAPKKPTSKAEPAVKLIKKKKMEKSLSETPKKADKPMKKTMKNGPQKMITQPKKNIMVQVLKTPSKKTKRAPLMKPETPRVLDTKVKKTNIKKLE